MFKSLISFLIVFCFLLQLSHSAESMSTTSKVCAIFGYGPGLSKAVAQKWSKEGFAVAAMARSLDKVKEAEDTIPNVKGYVCDVTKPDDVASTVASIEKDLGPIDCLVYNAGKGVWKPWDQLPIADFEQGFQTNVSGLLKASQEIVPKMIERGHGTVLITGATASLQTRDGGVCPSKGCSTLVGTGIGS